MEFKRGRRLFNASQERVFRIVQRQKAEHEFREAPPLIGGQHFNDGQKQRTKQCLKIRTACAIYFRKPLLPSLFHRRSEAHTSELQSLMRISYAVFCLKKKKDTI